MAAHRCGARKSGPGKPLVQHPGRLPRHRERPCRSRLTPPDPAPANPCDGSDQNGGNRYGALVAERPAMASHPSRAALIKLLKRRRGAERKDRSAMWVLLDYLLPTYRRWVSRARRRNDQTARECRTLFTQSSHVHRRALVALTTTPKSHRADRACIPHRDPGAEAGVLRGIRPRSWRERQALSSFTREPQDALDPGRLPRSTGDPTKPSATGRRA
jgi:hypothetical protein